MDASTCPYCGEGPIERERRPDGNTRCLACGVFKTHVVWEEAVRNRSNAFPAAKVIALAPEEQERVALHELLGDTVYGRLEVLAEVYSVDPRAVLCLLVTDAYMERLPAFRDAEGD